MALKANRVGVAPTEVDALGHIIGGDVPSNVLTVNDIVDSLQSMDATKVLSAKQGNTLNSKLRTNTPTGYHSFWFAYDSETDRYGYKVDNDPNQFHPFSSGVEESGLYLLNPTPFESVSDKVTLEEGGYELISGEIGVMIVKGIVNVELSHDETIISFSANMSNVGDYKILSSNNKFSFNNASLGSIRANGTVAKDTEILIYGLYRRT